jgi:signal transduction histidine kinase
MPLRTRTPLAIANITGNERAAPVQDTLLAEGMLSVMELPLIIDDSGLGVLALYFTEAQTFGAEQMELLRSYATQASLAIKNARTYTSTDRALQRSVDQLVALADIGKLLASTINLDSIGELVLNHAADATHANSGAVALFDEVTDDLRVVAHIGYRDGQFIDPELIRQGAAGKVLNTGATLRLDNITRAAGYRSLRPTTSSQLAVPIARGKTMLGCILLEGDVPASFTADDSQFVGQIANQAVVAIDNANLFRRITEARDRLQVILNAMEEAIILIDRRGRVVLANPRITTLGLEPDTIVERPLEGLLRVESLRLPERLGFKNMEDAVAFARSAADPDQWPTAPHLYSVQVSGSTHFIQRNVIPVQDEDGMVIGGLLVFYDKSEEQELAHAREQLSRMLVHDLRSPLTAVTTTLKLLNEIIPADSEYHELVTETTGSSRRALRKLLNRVDSLLDISRMESGRLSIETEITDLDELAEAVIEELGPLARELEVSVTANLNAATPPLDVDGDKVERLLINLVDNALKYAPAESKIEIRSYPAGENGAEAGFVRVDVTDQGPGIPTEYKETLFDSFVQVEGRERVRRGVGLGLSFCKLTAEAHGGRIWIEDNPGGGSVFAFTLPAATLTRLPEDEDETSVSLG